MKEFNIYDLYLNQVKQDDIYNSKEYKYLKDNNIDTAEIEGIDKDPDAGEILFNKDQKLSDEENKIFLKDVADFMLDIPRDAFISALRGGTNGMQFVNNFAGAVGLTGEETTEEFNLKFDKIKSDLDNAQEDSSLVTKMIGMAGQDAMYVYPIYKKLEKAGLPKMWRMPLSFALGGALAFDKKESFFVDSNSMRNLKSFIGVAEDTPIEEMYDKAVQAIEFGAFGKIFDDVLGLAKNYKTMNKDRIKQADIAVGGSAASAAVVEQFTEDPDQASTDTLQNIEPSEEKKNPNFNDDEIIPGTVNEYGFEKTSSLVPIFKSVLKETAKKLPNKGSGEQILNTLKNTPGVKQQELKWSGLDDFLKEKKTATNDEVKEFLNLNSLDIEEVQFGGPTSKVSAKLADEVENAKNEFERKVLNEMYEKDPDMIGESVDELLNEINYDIYSMRFDNDPPGRMDFNTLRTLLGENPNLNMFKNPDSDLLELKLPENNPQGGDSVFKIRKMEFEKYLVEEKVRKARGVGNAPKFERYTEPGGEDYTELVFKIKKGGMDVGIPVEAKQTVKTSLGKEIVSEPQKSTIPFKNPSHMNVKSEIAHVRFKTRDLDGQKILAVEEMQSDFATAVRKGQMDMPGFDNLEKQVVQDFPFKNTWYEMTIRRLIRYAADNDFDAVAIPKAKPMMDRYMESAKTIDNLNIKVFRHPRGSMFLDETTGGTNLVDPDLKAKELYRFKVDYKEGDKLQSSTIFDGNEVYNTLKGFKVSDDITKQIDDVIAGKGKFTADELTIDAPIKKVIVGSGKGKVQLYEQAIPSYMKKYAKKWNAKVYDDRIEAKELLYRHGDMHKQIPVTIIKLTPEMKQSVQQDGQALFNIFGIGTGAAIGSDAILDNQQNNTISNLTEN